ncbi:MAG: PorT family protein [Saprospiraceae bacterium]|nr:PorT family protein [Saprospiraceae bacterium]
MKRILFVLLTAFTLQLVNAQTHIGFTMGANTNNAAISGISPSFLPELNPYTGFAASIQASLNIDRHFSFRPSLGYTEKGFIMKETTTTDIIGIDLPIGLQANTRMNYVDLAAALQYDYAKSGGFHGYVYAGPSLAYATSAHVQTKTNFIIDVNVKRFDIDLSDDMYNRMELGAVIGTGIGTTLGKGELFADISYRHGFTDQINDPILDIGIKNRSVQFGIGMLLKFRNYDLGVRNLI